MPTISQLIRKPRHPKTYREKARKKLASMEGASCPTGLATPEKDAVAAHLAEWFNHFERVQWMLRLSSRLRKLHND